MTSVSTNVDKGGRGPRLKKKKARGLFFVVVSVQALEFQTFAKWKMYCSLFRTKSTCSKCKNVQGRLFAGACATNENSEYCSVAVLNNALQLERVLLACLGIVNWKLGFSSLYSFLPQPLQILWSTNCTHYWQHPRREWSTCKQIVTDGMLVILTVHVAITL